ncbi:MAG: type II secretion system protein GspG [Acidobacteria bacterium]|nr:type II secretion system protein GspG [Acidobacteriota bacterium]
MFLVVAFAFCAFAADAAAQKRPKPALKESDARRAVAEAPGFALSKGAVKVKEVSPAGSAPVTVSAGVRVAFRLVRVEDERVPQTGGVFKLKRWRAAEFRTGDRAWEDFDLFAEAVGAERLEAARGALEELVTEFEAQQAKVGGGWGVTALTVEDEAARASEAGAKKKKKEKKKDEPEQKAAEPLTRGPLTIKQLSLMGASAVAEVVVEGVFTLAKDARGRWRAAGFEVGGEAVGDLETLWRSIDTRKAARARADLAEMREALEAFRRERGFYVVGEDSAVLFDHLNPRYAKRVIRLDPWHNPYRYAGTQASYTLASDGPDGKSGTADDVTLSR